jgi:hypothetical protein
MEKKYNKSVRFTDATDEKFGKVAEKLGRSKQDLLADMVDYFYKSKKDPADLSDELLKKELGQGINRIISFIKVQEKDILAPMLAEQKIQMEQIQGLGTQFEAFFEMLPEGKIRGKFVQLANEMVKGSNASKDALILVQRNQQAVYDLLKGKEKYQDHCMRILEHYIQVREGLNSITQARLVKDLQDETRRQLRQI